MDHASFFAHSRDEEPESTWEPLDVHLDRVAELARTFASAFDSEDWGYLAGLWHDLGKYRPEFQRRIRGSKEQAPHASAGAAFADERHLRPLAFVIAGHHSGLANTITHHSATRPLGERIREGQGVLREITSVLPPILAEQRSPAPPPFLMRAAQQDANAGRRSFEFWTRFLFSALIDADRLATEAFYEPDKRAALGDVDAIPALRARLDSHLDELRADTAVKILRSDVLADCRAAAEHAPGLFSLSAPTGAGKTFSSMAFALRHAERHGLRRVIVVIPYTSIIEQTAQVYGDVLDERNIVEHHSNIDEAAAAERDSEAELRRRLAVENWDAPIIVTTSVQFFESLFASKPSRCRKLHNVARSVVIVDEAQTLPTEFLHCVIDAMRELTAHYGCSLVLSTATQPALARRDALPGGLDGVHEIVSGPRTLMTALERVTVEWPKADRTTTSYADVARELVGHQQALAIVHLRKDARNLAERLPAEGRFHLSTQMCAAHRAETLRQIRDALVSESTCRVVATQLVEAGVDIDFPVVYRAMAGLDSLAQAAGRCNREGKLCDAAGRMLRGRFKVFRAETLPPRGVLRKGLGVAEEMLSSLGERLSLVDPDILSDYFRRLYFRTELDQRNVMVHREQLDFATVGELVRFIDDGEMHPLIVPWGDVGERVSRFVHAPNRGTQRALQPFVVQVRRWELDTLQKLGAVSELAGFGYVLAPHYKRLYDPKLGLLIDDEAPADPEALVV